MIIISHGCKIAGMLTNMIPTVFSSARQDNVGPRMFLEVFESNLSSVY